MKWGITLILIIGIIFIVPPVDSKQYLMNRSTNNDSFIIDGWIDIDASGNWDDGETLIWKADDGGTGAQWVYILMQINAIPSGATIHNANISFEESAVGGSNAQGNSSIWVIHNYTWTTALDWDTKIDGVVITNTTPAVGDGGTPTYNLTLIVEDGIANGTVGGDTRISWMMNISQVNAGGNALQYMESTNTTVVGGDIKVVIEYDDPTITLSSPTINISNSSVVTTGDYINGSVTVTTGGGQPSNVTMILYINNTANQTAQLLNDFANGSVVSYIFNDTNMSENQTVVIGFNATHGFSGSDQSNSSAITLIPTHPNGTINAPNGTETDASNVSWTFNFTENGVLDTCYYNVTKGDTVDVSNTDITCANGTGSFSLDLGDGTFTVNLFVNDSLNLINSSSQTFTLSTAGDGGGGGGGGGGPSSALFSAGSVCTSNSQCQQGICARAKDSSSKVCYTNTADLCGNNFCDREFGESNSQCSVDCSIFNITPEGGIDLSRPGQIALGLLALSIFLIVSPNIKVKKTARKIPVVSNIRGFLAKRTKK